jgi:hypothetical protein
MMTLQPIWHLAASLGLMLRTGQVTQGYILQMEWDGMTCTRCVEEKEGREREGEEEKEVRERHRKQGQVSERLPGPYAKNCTSYAGVHSTDGMGV